jgi:RNA polymerase sigma factor (sigma-70 family)
MTEQQLIISNSKLISTIVRKFKPKSIHEEEELLQVGRLGLLYAIRRHNKKYALSTIAWKCISNEILRYLKKEKRLRMLPLTKNIIEKESFRMWEFLPELSENDNSILKLKYEMFSNKEIAEKYNCSVSNINKKWKTIKETIVKANA